MVAVVNPDAPRAGANLLGSRALSSSGRIDIDRQ